MTYVDDPFRPSDATVLRPRPGAGRRGGAEPPRPGPSSSGAEAAALADPALDDLGTGLNPLLRAASPLLLLAGRLRGTVSAADVGGLRRHALDEIRRFEERARAGGVASEIVLAARYVLCAALDEAVLSTPWGAHSEWAQQTLLVVLHREAWGGEKFFEMLDRLGADPARHLDLMELQYLCLAFGFAGKYQVVERGDARLGEVRHDLYRRLRDLRDRPPAELSIRWRGLEDRRNPLIRYVPWWVVGAAAMAVLALTFVFLYTRLGTLAAPVEAALARVGVEDFTTPVAAAPATGPTLKQLLAADERNGTMRVEEEGGLTRVTLLAADLFASGSAAVNAAHAGTLDRLARAIEQVPGRVMVIGHTDDQPVRSLRFRDNFELSRERARGVAATIQAAVANPARIQFNGVGSSEPRYRPESDPGNRARNRRVEIVHRSQP